jgi:hypothetical protein
LEYLYGDATPSSLDRNYIQYLRDLLELTTGLLGGYAVTAKLVRDAGDREMGAGIVHKQLTEVDQRIQGTLDGCLGPQMTAIAAGAVDRMKALCKKEHQRAETDLKTTLASDLAKINKAIAAERAKNHGLLEKMLLKHDLPESTQWVSVLSAGEGSYRATLTGQAGCGVSWLVDLAIPIGHLLSETLRVERLAPQLAVKLPQESGWVRKSVKLRTHKLSAMVVTEIARTPEHTVVKLRSSSQEDTGYDLLRPVRGQALAVVRVEKGVADEPYEPDAEDSASLHQLYQELLGAAVALKDSRAALVDGRFEGTPLRELTDPSELVRRLIGQAAPVVREIAKHSLSPTELVLKRVLADDRREEIFASKADLREMVDALPHKLRQAFAPLGLDDESDPRPSHVGAEPPPEEPTRVVTPLPKPSTPPPRRFKTRPGIPNPNESSPGPPGPPPRMAPPPVVPPPGQDSQPSTTSGEKTGDSVEVPLDDLESK